eukprot:1762573-Pleurochrysis_carterae.AAC.1
MTTQRATHQCSEYIARQHRRLFSIPPVRATGGRALLSDIHNLVAKRKKQTRRQRLGEEIGQVVGAAHERHRDVVRFEALPHEEMASIDMLGALMVLRIVSEIDGRLVVQRQAGRRIGRQPQIVEQRSQVHCLFCRFGGGNNLRFT